MDKNKIFGLVIILLVIPLLYFGYQIYSGELQFKTVLSGSMSPAINAGDAILISGINPEEIKEQDIITFREGETFTTHRVVEIVNNTFRTKGDANEDTDTKAIKTDQIVGKLVFTIPYLGYFGHFVRTIPGFLIFILIPGILIIYSEIKKIKTETKAKPKYEVTRIEKREILSKLGKRILNYNKSLKKTLGIYLIFAFLLVFLFPFYTGGFFSDIELSTNNLFEAADCFKGGCMGDCVEVNLTSPENNILTNDSNPDFNFTATSDINITFPCELFIDDTGYGANDSVSNNTATIITANSSLSEGTYNWYINCTDNTTTKSPVSVITIDTTNPEISYNPNTDPSGTHYVTSKDWIFINITASDINKDTVLFEWDGTNESFVNQDGDIYWENKTGLNDRSYTIKAYINDTAGNTNRTKTREIEILTNNTGCCGCGGSGGKGNGGTNGNGNEENNSTETSDFSINLIYPTNNSYTNKNTTDFNFTVSGTENNYNCELFLRNQTGNWADYGKNGSVQNNSQTTIIPNQSFENLSEGIYNWFINCTYNKITSLSETRNLTIDRTAPVVNLINKSFSTNKSLPEIYFNFTDVLSPNAGCVLYFNNSAVGNNNSVTKNITTSLIPNSTQPDGNYTVYVNCTDLAGNKNKSEEINVSIDAPLTTKATAIKENRENYTFGKWTNSTYVNITLNCSAPDCNTTLYCNDTNNSCEPNLTNSTPVQISTEGISYIRFRSNVFVLGA